jgi:hypothetical protein
MLGSGGRLDCAGEASHVFGQPRKDKTLINESRTPGTVRRTGQMGTVGVRAARACCRTTVGGDEWEGDTCAYRVQATLCVATGTRAQ